MRLVVASIIGSALVGATFALGAVAVAVGSGRWRR